MKKGVYCDAFPLYAAFSPFSSVRAACLRKGKGVGPHAAYAVKAPHAACAAVLPKEDGKGFDDAHLVDGKDRIESAVAYLLDAKDRIESAVAYLLDAKDRIESSVA